VLYKHMNVIYQFAFKQVTLAVSKIPPVPPLRKGGTPIPHLIKGGQGGFSRTESHAGEWCQCYLYEGASVIGAGTAGPGLVRRGKGFVGEAFR